MVLDNHSNEDDILHLVNTHSPVRPWRSADVPPTHIIGAGPGGLVAAITLARLGYSVIIHEKAKKVGSRFNEDFQGLDNWTLGRTVPHFLDALHIRENFRCVPYYGGDFFGPDNRRRHITTREPLFYLIKRGADAESLDRGLLQQALDFGAEIQWGEGMQSLPPKPVIVGTGPKAADAIAKGYTFSTDHPDYCAGFLDNRIAPKAYAYLLVNQGRGTFATCMFTDFHNVNHYFKRAVERLHRLVEIEITKPTEFGGYINFFLDRPKGNTRGIYYVGENNGFQDALWGFGLKYAMFSGHLEALSIISGESYQTLCQRWIEPSIRSSLANRWIWAHLGNTGYRKMLDWVGDSQHPFEILRNKFQNSMSKKILYKIARRWYHTRRVDEACAHDYCDCVWCRCERRRTTNSYQQNSAPRLNRSEAGIQSLTPVVNGE